MKLFLRTYANCESVETSQAIAARMLLALSRFTPETHSTPKRYWKIPKLFEFTFSLFPATHASFRSIVETSSAGWVHSESENELSSVWNRGKDNVFLVPESSWAEVQLHETAA